MSIYAVDKIGHHAVFDEEFVAALRADPEGALRAVRPPLSEREIQLLLAGDVGTLGRMGANFFLLHQLARVEVLGLTLPLYAERIRAEYAAERAEWAAAERPE